MFPDTSLFRAPSPESQFFCHYILLPLHLWHPSAQSAFSILPLFCPPGPSPHIRAEPPSVQLLRPASSYTMLCRQDSCHQGRPAPCAAVPAHLQDFPNVPLHQQTHCKRLQKFHSGCQKHSVPFPVLTAPYSAWKPVPGQSG